MRRRRYPRYKPSGINWLGDVPEHWQVKRLKSLASYRVSNVNKVPSDDEIPVRLCNYTDVYYNEIIRPEMILMEGTATFEEISRFSLRKNDVLITKDSEEWSDIAVPALVEETETDVVCGYHLAIVRPISGKLHGAFLLRLLQSPGVNQQFQIAATGVTRYGLPKSAIGNAWLPVPPLDEQMAMADFLSAALRKIEILVQGKRALIERLREKRSALISRVVTRGLPSEAARAADLNPEPKLKPSGVGWIGNMPAHWETRRLRHISDHITVGVVVNPSTYVTDEGVPFLVGGDVREFGIDIAACHRCPKETSDGPLIKSRLDEGDLVVVRVGYPGVTAVVPPDLEGANCASMMIVRKHPRFSSEWLAYAFNSQIGRDQIQMVQYGAAQKQFNISHAVDFSFPFPPLKEQRLIARHLDRELMNIETMVSKVETAIDRLQEYRIALIAAAITGKVDVRDDATTHEQVMLAAGG